MERNRFCIAKARLAMSWRREALSGARARQKKCYTKRIWDGKVGVNTLAQSEMKKRGKWHGRTKKIQLKGVSYELYDHLKMQMIHEDQIKLPHKWWRATKITNGDLSNENKRIRHDSEMMREITEPAVKKLRSFLGSHFMLVNTDPVLTMKHAQRRRAGDLRG